MIFDCSGCQIKLQKNHPLQLITPFMGGTSVDVLSWWQPTLLSFGCHRKLSKVNCQQKNVHLQGMATTRIWHNLERKSMPLIAQNNIVVLGYCIVVACHYLLNQVCSNRAWQNQAAQLEGRCAWLPFCVIAVWCLFLDISRQILS